METCPRCGLRFEREEGAFLGSLVLNYAMSAVLGILVMIAWFALTLPDTAIVPMMLAVLTVVIGGVPLLYPFAKMLWVAIDLMMRSDERP